jgi:hypothetical protein
MIHPETGAILRRRKRTETITYQGQSRTVEVEGWFPDDDGDGVLVGADSKPLDDALAEMKCGWPGKPGVPLNPERDGWHWLVCPLKHDVFPRFWRAAGEAQNCRWTAKWFYSRNDWNPKECTYLAPVLTPAEVEARIATARKDALEEAAQFVETHTYVTTNSALKHKLVPYARAKRGLHHTTIAAAIRALKGEGND